MIILLLLFFAYLFYLLVVNLGKLYELILLNVRCSKNLAGLKGPPRLPLIGSAHLFKWDSYDFTTQMEQWAQTYLFAKLNPEPGEIDGLMMIYVGPVPLIFLGTPEAVRPVLESNVNISKPNQYDKLRDWIGTGLLTSTYRKWFARRKIITPTFHFSIIREYFPIFSAQGEILVDVLDAYTDSDDFFNIFPYLKRCTLDVICETAMGVQISAQLGKNNDYVRAVKRISEITWAHIKFPWLWLRPVWYLSGLGFEFDRNVKLTNEFTRKVIQERKETLHEIGYELSKRKAFLDLLLTMQKDDPNVLSDEDIREEVDTFMFEGHDTTASGIGFTILFLGFHPECQSKVHKEMDDVFGSSNRAPTMEDMKKCVYLEKCIKEALRMFPSVPLIARRLDEDVTIDHPSGQQITLPKGLTACITPISVARDPRSWPDPDTFNPDNFDLDACSQRDPYAYIPFAAGPRNCIGQKFAILEEKTILSWIFRKFDVVSLDTLRNRRPIPELILRPVDGVFVKLKRR